MIQSASDYQKAFEVGGKYADSRLLPLENVLEKALAERSELESNLLHPPGVGPQASIKYPLNLRKTS
jgi:hypothetical protein